MVLVLKDFLLPETPFRGLITQSDFCLCAYIGVPETHWLADMEGLHFKCHWGLTFNAQGGDGLRPAGWHWYGWDYGHAGDQLNIPEELIQLLQERGVPMPLRSGKQWSVEEVMHDVIDVAVSLQEALVHTERTTQAAVQGLVQF